MGATSTELIALDDHFAMSHFWRGLSLLGRGRVEEGRAALIEANRRDRRGTRANPMVTETICLAANEAGAVLVRVDELFDRELEAEFRRLAGGGDQQLFVDHCHPTGKGHALIAEAVRAVLK